MFSWAVGSVPSTTFHLQGQEPICEVSGQLHGDQPTGACCSTQSKSLLLFVPSTEITYFVYSLVAENLKVKWLQREEAAQEFLQSCQSMSQTRDEEVGQDDGLWQLYHGSQVIGAHMWAAHVSSPQATSCLSVVLADISNFKTWSCISPNDHFSAVLKQRYSLNSLCCNCYQLYKLHSLLMKEQKIRIWICQVWDIFFPVELC